MNINQKRLKRQEFWRDQIKSWKRSGLSQSEHCKQNGIDEHLFSKWKIKLIKNKGSDERKLMQIPIKLENDFSKPDEIELVIKGHYRIIVQSGFNPETLKRIIKAIEGVRNDN